MKRLSKRGQGTETMSLSYAIGAIVGILLAAIIVTIAFQLVQQQNRAADSLLILTDTLSDLEDGGEEVLLYTLPSSYSLVGFNEGDFGNPGISTLWHCPQDEFLESYVFTWQLDKPDICGDKPCLCVCRKTAFESVLSPNACSRLQSQCEVIDVETEEARLVDPKCSYGPFLIGTSSGATTLFIEREGNSYFVCTEEGCITPEFEEIVNAMKSYVDDYQTCLNKEGACQCDLDPTFLGERFALVFTATEIQLWDSQTERIIFVESFDTGVSVTSEKRSDLFDRSDPVVLYVLGESFVVSSSTDDIKSEEDMEEKQVPVAVSLLKGEGMSFVDSDTVFSEYQSCSEIADPEPETFR